LALGRRIEEKGEYGENRDPARGSKRHWREG
jgi:hypothetical protein